jgi:hypothetical protein
MMASNGSTVLLDRKLGVSQVHVNAEVKKILSGVIRQAIVKVYRDYYYQVDFGPEVRPQYHIVTHDLWCCCALEDNCAAVIAVRMHLRDVGEFAKTPRPGYFPSCPNVCPICSARACYEPNLSSKHRGVGWLCSRYGTSHYWQYQGSLPRPVCPA